MMEGQADDEQLARVLQDMEINKINKQTTPSLIEEFKPKAKSFTRRKIIRNPSLQQATRQTHLAGSFANTVDVEQSMIIGDANACLVGWNSMVRLHHGEDGIQCTDCKLTLTKGSELQLSRVQHTMKRLDDGRTPISKMTTLGVTSCTVFVVMDEDDVLFCHVDSAGLNVLSNIIMNKPFDGRKTRVFASAVSNEELMVVKDMIKHINPASAYILNRGDRKNADDVIFHDEIGLELIENEGRTDVVFSGDLQKGVHSEKNREYSCTKDFAEITRISIPRGD